MQIMTYEVVRAMQTERRRAAEQARLASIVRRQGRRRPWHGWWHRPSGGRSTPVTSPAACCATATAMAPAAAGASAQTIRDVLLPQ